VKCKSPPPPRRAPQKRHTTQPPHPAHPPTHPPRLVSPPPPPPPRPPPPNPPLSTEPCPRRNANTSITEHIFAPNNLLFQGTPPLERKKNERGGMRDRIFLRRSSLFFFWKSTPNSKGTKSDRASPPSLSSRSPLFPPHPTKRPKGASTNRPGSFLPLRAFYREKVCFN